MGLSERGEFLQKCKMPIYMGIFEKRVMGLEPTTATLAT